jgi:hypothetical protein
MRNTDFNPLAAFAGRRAFIQSSDPLPTYLVGQPERRDTSMSHVSRSQAKELVGQQVYALRSDGTVVKGRLVKVRGNELFLEPSDGKARTKAFIPLVLFDLLAIGTSPFAFGFGGFGFDGFW